MDHVARGGRTRAVTASQARRYLAKAEEYAGAASSELDAQRGIAATSVAIHAAINAADAVCGVRLGERAESAERKPNSPDPSASCLRQRAPSGGFEPPTPGLGNRPGHFPLLFVSGRHLRNRQCSRAILSDLPDASFCIVLRRFSTCDGQLTDTLLAEDWARSSC